MGCTFDSIEVKGKSFSRNEVVVMKRRRMEDADCMEFSGSSFLAVSSLFAKEIMSLDLHSLLSENVRSKEVK